MQDGDVKVFLAVSGNFLSNTPDTAYSAQAISRCRLTAHVSTKLNRSHLVTGTQALILPCLGRAERDIQSSGLQFVTTEDSMGIVNASTGKETPASAHLLSDVAILARLAHATFRARGPINWLAFEADYSLIRDAISRVIPGFENFNDRIVRERHFYLPNAARELIFKTETTKAQFTVCPVPDDTLQADQLILMTMRSHDQFNSTIYGLNDRYRGVYGGRRVIFLNPSDIEQRNLHAGDLVDIHSHFEGEIRKAAAFAVVPYTIPPKCAAAYYPETNVLVPIRSVAAKSNQPAYKRIVISLHPSSRTESVDVSESGIYSNLTRPIPSLAQ